DGGLAPHAMLPPRELVHTHGKDEERWSQQQRWREQNEDAERRAAALRPAARAQPSKPFRDLSDDVDQTEHRRENRRDEADALRRGRRMELSATTGHARHGPPRTGCPPAVLASTRTDLPGAARRPRRSRVP